MDAISMCPVRPNDGNGRHAALKMQCRKAYGFESRFGHMVSRDAPYRATFRYGENAKPPRKKGEVAISTIHDTWASLYAELEAGKRRKDIGTIDWTGPEHYGTIVRRLGQNVSDDSGTMEDSSMPMSKGPTKQ